MKLLQITILIVGAIFFMLIGGLLATVLPIGDFKTTDSKDSEYVDKPRYAPGEATAMMERAYDLRATYFSETYAGQGIWEVYAHVTEGKAKFV